MHCHPHVTMVQFQVSEQRLKCWSVPLLYNLVKFKHSQNWVINFKFTVMRFFFLYQKYPLNTDQSTSTTANSDEAWLNYASLALACRGRGPAPQQQGRGSWDSRGSQLLLLLLAKSLDLLWRYRDGLTRTMRGMTQGDITDRGSGGQGRDIQSTKAKGTHKERKVQRGIISSRFKCD